MAYSPEEIEKVFEEICLRIEEGEPTRQILKETRMPSTSTFYQWLSNCEIKAKRYAYACDIRTEVIAEEMLEIADDGTNDLMTIQKGDISYEQENKEVVNRSKLRIETRKWLLAKMNPKKFGDRLDLTTKGDKLQLGATFEVEMQ